jgi:hypothetical protein
MRASVRSSVTTTLAIAAAGVLVATAAAAPTEPHALTRVQPEFRLSAATTPLTSAAPPLGAPIEQFVLNQLEDCSLICPFILQGVVQVPVLFAILPLTLVVELQQGVPFVQAALLSDATVSGALNDAVTHIIDNDLNLVLPRAQNALEVAVVGLIDLAINTVANPASFLQAFNDFRATALNGLRQPPGTMPPPKVHNEFEAAVVKAIDITSALTFQAPERLLLGLTQAGDAFFRTLGTTGDLNATVQAVGASVSTTLTDSLNFITRAFNESVPITAPSGTLTKSIAVTAPQTAGTPTTLAAVTNTPQKVLRHLGEGKSRPDARTPGSVSNGKTGALSKHHKSDDGSGGAKGHDKGKGDRPRNESHGKRG